MGQTIPATIEEDGAHKGPPQEYYSQGRLVCMNIRRGNTKKDNKVFDFATKDNADAFGLDEHAPAVAGILHA